MIRVTASIPRPGVPSPVLQKAQTTNKTKSNQETGIAQQRETGEIGAKN